MQAVSVADLKANLSRYLAVVKKGKEILVTSHRHPVARLMPLEKPAPSLEIMPATKPVSSLKKIKGISLKCDPAKFLFEDRRRS